MKRGTAVVLVLVACGAVGAVLRSSLAPQPQPSAAAAKPTAPEEVLQAEAYVVSPEAVRDTVRTVGTLVANESVNVAAELSRRLVTVHAARSNPAKSRC